MKKILLLVFLMFSVGFSNNTYKTTYDKSFKQTKKNETLNNSKIEKSLNNFFDAEQMKNPFASSSESDDNTNDNTFESLDALEDFFIVFSKSILKYTNYSISGINYLSPNKADVVLKINTPELDDTTDEDIFTSLMDKKFKKRTNKNINDLDNMTEQEEKEYFKIFLEIMEESFDEILAKNKDYTTITKTVSFEKINNEWVAQENIINFINK